jgi:hypothetical protein
MTSFLRQFQRFIGRVLTLSCAALAAALPGAGHLLALSASPSRQPKPALDLWYPWAPYDLRPCLRTATPNPGPVQPGEATCERCGDHRLAASS